MFFSTRDGCTIHLSVPIHFCCFRTDHPTTFYFYLCVYLLIIHRPRVRVKGVLITHPTTKSPGKTSSLALFVQFFNANATYLTTQTAFSTTCNNVNSSLSISRQVRLRCQCDYRYVTLPIWELTCVCEFQVEQAEGEGAKVRRSIGSMNLRNLSECQRL
jgi:hypothetical protein